ncbi:FecR domain-containing protein [Nodosilinea sp. LEGE 06152]|uniref:FecR family protein n=1 Tax=Nodosilinea sp. LEGE 06152 TaxID=2777966 RepID=UPI001880BF74|nr:FecR domain-containing protein [Nodosilinea sp. LEGE 06152]MBE9156903.1 FecR domain-containing protein [Nodosilinea sp. LEGE 06152]
MINPIPQPVAHAPEPHHRQQQRLVWWGVSIFTALTVAFAAHALPVRVNRGLSVRQLQGEVTLLRPGRSAPAAVGDRLDAVGDGLRTGTRSSVVLEVDTDVGFLDVSERTELRIRTLEMAADGGRITHLSVPRGQVRTRLRRFTNQGSQFEIETPAGISGVRGTEFGVSVQENGKTGIAILTGAVDTSAVGETVAVPAGFQNLIWPGEPPTQPVPLRDDPGLTYERQVIFENRTRYVSMTGRVDPVNTVLVDGAPQAVDRQGEFRITRLATARLRVEVVVTTPLGRQEIHEIYLL